MPGESVRVKATGKIGTVSGIQDNPEKTRVSFEDSQHGYFKDEELARIHLSCGNKFKTDEDDLKKIDSLLASKKECAPEPGDIFEAFGATYQAVEMCSKYPCCKCAFSVEHCELNVDIPFCREGVIFKRVDGAELVAVDSNGQDVGRVDRFVANELRVEPWANPISLYDFVRKGYKLEVRVKLAED